MSIDLGYAFLKPLLKTYEALIALGTREGWDTANQGVYSIGLGGLLQPMFLGLRLLMNFSQARKQYLRTNEKHLPTQSLWTAG